MNGHAQDVVSVGAVSVRPLAAPAGTMVRPFYPAPGYSQSGRDLLRRVRWAMLAGALAWSGITLGVVAFLRVAG